MDKKSKIALYAIGAVILFMIVVEVAKPRPLNWSDSYSALDKIPLGGYVIYNELKNETKQNIPIINKNIYEYLYTIDSTVTNQSLVFINNYINLGGQESQAILDFVDRGNTVFVSTGYFSGMLADTLKISLNRDFENLFKQVSINSFTSDYQAKNNTVFNDVIENSYFASVDTLNTTVLGMVSKADSTHLHPNFIKVNYGVNDGAFYIHSNPFAFTNYHMLNGKEAYAATVLSYLPKSKIIWDNYYKSGRKIISSPLRYVLLNKSLKWAFYIALLGLVMFVIFKGKRTQRIIPVIEPLKNSTVEFTSTIGDLYYQHGNFSNIISKKIVYFLDYVRSSFYLNTDKLNQEFVNKLALKSGNSTEDTLKLIDFIALLKSKKQHSEKDLIELNKKIEHFKNKTT
ncbi:MAG: DUF4350 domain-containing protein [Winogradskyella sp.]|nr:DUF4350 domain-containing protein [Winogradskyella sp.]